LLLQIWIATRTKLALAEEFSFSFHEKSSADYLHRFPRAYYVLYRLRFSSVDNVVGDKPEEFSI